MLDLFAPRRCVACDVPHPDQLCDACRPLGALWAERPIAGIREVVPWAPYDGPIGHTLQQLKTAADRAKAVTLARHFADAVAPRLQQVLPATVVPAPSPTWRRTRRGFSVSAILANALGASLGCPVVHALRDSGGTPQQGLDAAARSINLDGRIRSTTSVEGTVILVDDVLTTGATAAACARELLGDATARVWLVTAAVVSRRPVTPD